MVSQLIPAALMLNVVPCAVAELHSAVIQTTSRVYLLLLNSVWLSFAASWLDVFWKLGAHIFPAMKWLIEVLNAAGYGWCTATKSMGSLPAWKGKCWLCRSVTQLVFPYPVLRKRLKHSVFFLFCFKKKKLYILLEKSVNYICCIFFLPC